MRGTSSRQASAALRRGARIAEGVELCLRWALGRAPRWIWRGGRRLRLESSCEAGGGQAPFVGVGQADASAKRTRRTLDLDKGGAGRS